VGCATLMIPYTPAGRSLGFHALPTEFLLAMGAIVATYVAAAELTKRSFYRSMGSHTP
jgi:hypothetical protein